MTAVLPDVLRPGLCVVFCGTAAGRASAAAGAYYAGPGNAFWPTLYAIGLTPRQLEPSEFRRLWEFGVGLTDLVKAESGADRDLTRGGFDVPSFRARILSAAPCFVAFNGKKAGETYLRRKAECGLQPEKIRESRIFVLPSTSGAARGSWDMRPWREFSRCVRRDPCCERRLRGLREPI
jgi:TDG/mug DNA glycosylase family protein